MIEILIKYIQDKGFEVIVCRGYLIIRKRVGDEFCSISWGISKHMLQPEYETYLYLEAQDCMDKVDRAIAEKVS